MFDKRWEERGGTPYIIRGFAGWEQTKGRRTADKRVGANMRPKGTGRAKRRKRSVQKGKEREIYERKRWKEGGTKAKTKPKEDGRRRRNKPKEERRKTKTKPKEDGRRTRTKPKKDGRRTGTKPKEDGRKTGGGRKLNEREMKTAKGRRKMTGSTPTFALRKGCTSTLGTERLRHTSPKTTRLFSTAGMFGANARFSACLFNTLITNTLRKNQGVPHSTFRITPCH